MKRSALILGGGIAGLAAADELARNKISVTLLEAKDRLGGRIHTFHPGNVIVELGAEFIHGRSQPLLRVLAEAKLSTEAVPDRQRIFSGGQFAPADIWETAGNVFRRINPQEPDCTFDEFLARQAIEEPARSHARHFVQGFDAADPGRASVHGLLRAQYAAEHMSGEEQMRVTAGYSALVDFLAWRIESAGGVLARNTAAQRVHWENGKVEVIAERNHSAETFSADGAVVALPLGILQADAVKFEPRLPDKVQAARELPFGNVIRIVFVFREAFWKDFGIVQAFDEPIPTWWSDSRGPLLTGWAGGPKAEALLARTPAELEALGLATLEKLFPGNRAAVREHFVASHYWNWAADPHIRGAYSYIPVNGLDLPKRLAAPVADTLFFAGEATVFDAQMGTVFGALESGLRAAGEFLRG